MIEKLIEYSIRNRFLVLILAAALAVLGRLRRAQHAGGRHPRPEREPGHRLHRLDGPQPPEIEDQITYPLSLKLQGLAGVKTVRSSSEFNFSMITIIFEDNIDFYFARQRVLEKLTLAGTFLPQGVVPYLAPDATALGQIFWYTVEGGDLDPGRRWALQKYYVGPELNSVPGVAEVGTVGGMPLEYQIDVDPNALRAYGVTLGELYDAVGQEQLRRRRPASSRRTTPSTWSAASAGSRTPGTSRTPSSRSASGTPVYVKNVAAVQLGTQFRRSVFEKDGNEVVGGVVMMRYGENPLAVTQRIKEKIQELQPACPRASTSSPPTTAPGSSTGPSTRSPRSCGTR